MTDDLIRQAREMMDAVDQFIPDGPWEYNDPEKFTQGHGKLSETAVYATGNAHMWRMTEVQGPTVDAEIAIAKFIAWCREGVPALIAELEKHRG